MTLVKFYETPTIFAAHCQAFLGSWLAMLSNKDSCQCWVFTKDAVS